MEDNILVLASFVVIVVYVGMIVGVVLILEDKASHTKSLYIGLEELLKNSENATVVETLRQIEWFYEKYTQSNPGAKKYYPSFISWIDLVKLQVILKRRSVKRISQYRSLLNDAIEKYEQDNPFTKCSGYQQELLQDMEKLSNENSEIFLKNVIHRTEEEFIRLSTDIKKNDKMNKLSIVIGTIGIIVSVMMAFIKF